MSLTSFCPVVTSTTLPKDEVVRSEKSTERTRPDGVHSSWLQVDQNRARNVFVGLDFIVVNVDTLKLEVVGALVDTVAVDAVLV